MTAPTPAHIHQARAADASYAHERISELETEVRDLRAAIQANHDTRYRTGAASIAVFAPPDVALFETAGTRWNRPPAWHPTPEQREAFRRDPDAAKRERAL